SGWATGRMFVVAAAFMNQPPMWLSTASVKILSRPTRASSTCGGTLPLRKPGTLTASARSDVACSTACWRSACGTSTVSRTLLSGSSSTWVAITRPIQAKGPCPADETRSAEPEVLVGAAHGEPGRRSSSDHVNTPAEAEYAEPVPGGRQVRKPAPAAGADVEGVDRGRRARGRLAARRDEERAHRGRVGAASCLGHMRQGNPTPAVREVRLEVVEVRPGLAPGYGIDAAAERADAEVFSRLRPRDPRPAASLQIEGERGLCEPSFGDAADHVERPADDRGA